MKVTLVCLNSKFSHTSLGIWYIREHLLATTDAEVTVIDTFANRAAEDVAAEVLKTAPDVVGFSVYIFNVEKTIAVARLVRSAGVRVVFGGPEATYNAEIGQYADSTVLGEGELAWEGIVNGDESPVIFGKSPKSIAYPYGDEFFKNAENRIVYFEASRGCPFSCSYCMSGGERFRQFPFDEVTTALSKFHGKGVRLVKFVDRTFNTDVKFAARLMRWLIDNFTGEGITFHFELEPELFDDNLFDVIESAPRGLLQFEIGFQSFNEDALKAVNRSTDLKRSTDNVRRLCSFQNAHIHTDLIVGLPEEGFLSFAESFNKLYALQSDQIQVGMLKVLKGSALANNLPSGYDVNKKPPYEVKKTPWLSPDEVSELKAFSVAVDAVYNTKRFRSIINFALKQSTPFDFYLALSKRIASGDGLFDVYAKVKDYLLERGADVSVAESLIKFDYLTSVNSKVLPPSAGQRYDKSFKGETEGLRQAYPNHRFYLFDVNPITLERVRTVVGFFNGQAFFPKSTIVSNEKD